MKDFCAGAFVVSILGFGVYITKYWIDIGDVLGYLLGTGFCVICSALFSFAFD